MKKLNKLNGKCALKDKVSTRFSNLSELSQQDCLGHFSNHGLNKTNSATLVNSLLSAGNGLLDIKKKLLALT